MLPDMCHWVKLAHLRAKQHEVVMGRSNHSTCSITFLVRRSYSPAGVDENVRLSVHPLCCNSNQMGISFKDQLKSPPIIMGPVQVLAAVRLGLKFIGSLLIETAASVLE